MNDDGASRWMAAHAPPGGGLPTSPDHDHVGAWSCEPIVHPGERNDLHPGTRNPGPPVGANDHSHDQLSITSGRC